MKWALLFTSEGELLVSPDPLDSRERRSELVITLTVELLPCPLVLLDTFELLFDGVDEYSVSVPSLL